MGWSKDEDREQRSAYRAKNSRRSSQRRFRGNTVFGQIPIGSAFLDEYGMPMVKFSAGAAHHQHNTAAVLQFDWNSPVTLQQTATSIP